ncbi:MAG: hypothetical protein K2N35_13760 [Muribaculaceae bacterium]|nr:hypothetical protein [Muribaculaceae bacterium]
MRNTSIIILLGLICTLGCTKENKTKDRSEATDMFHRICKLTKEYSEKLNNAPDSSAWAAACSEYEDKLDKISFSYPPDTDLLLTEGQNDTIHALMKDYIKARDGRIHDIMYPKVEIDSLVNADSVISIEPAGEVSQADASRSPGN